MNVIIDNRVFPDAIGKRILKAKHVTCSFQNLMHAWDEIPELTFASIVKDLEDAELRRIAFRYLGIDRMMAELKPRLVASETIRKTGAWVGEDGTVSIHDYDDTYELYRVAWRDVFIGVGMRGLDKDQQLEMRQDQHFVKFKDTSTGRDHVIWCDLRKVFRTNNPEVGPEENLPKRTRMYESLVNPIMAIAWTIRTDVEPGGIESIIRQGDCILVRPLPEAGRLESPRHLMEYEYRFLLQDES